MALCCASSSQGDTSPRITSAARDPTCVEMIFSVASNCRHDFVSVQKLSRTLQTAARNLRSMASKEQFVLFSNFKDSDLGAFDRIQDRLSYRVSQFNDFLIVRIMPSVKHEESGYALWYLIRRKVTEMGLSKSLRSTGTATVCGAGQAGEKQPDMSFVPVGTRTTGDMKDVPSLVIEIGISESLSQLRIDAAWWLLNTRWYTKFVILLHVDVSSETIHIEIWNMPTGSGQPPSGGRPSREERALDRPRKSFELDITHVGGQPHLSHDNPLDIPWHYVWDQYPGALGARRPPLADQTNLQSFVKTWGPKPSFQQLLDIEAQKCLDLNAPAIDDDTPITTGRNRRSGARN